MTDASASWRTATAQLEETADRATTGDSLARSWLRWYRACVRRNAARRHAADAAVLQNLTLPGC